MGTVCEMPCPAYAEYYRASAASALLAGARGLYLYQVQPHLPAKSWVGAIYMVGV